MQPIIDVHEHIFRGRDIPVEGYLYSREYPGAWQPLARFLRLPTLLARCIRGRRQNTGFGPLCRFLIRLAGSAGREDYREWAEILTLRNVEEVAAALLASFEDDRIDLFVPLMVDFEYWFRNTVDTPLVRQLDDLYRYVVLPCAGRVHPFVPFDPLRELAYLSGTPSPDGGLERQGSMALVDEAVRNKGFIGVKLYNSLGYRPWGNEEVDAERRGLLNRVGMGRYASFSGAAIDGVLEGLYAYCEANEVPITAHCVADGIESYPRASYVFACPERWRPVLERHPWLHLNLAHFGWCRKERYRPRAQLRDGARVPWVNQVCELLSAFPSVYADVAHHLVFSPEEAGTFLGDYRLLLHDYPEAVPKKLLFGIDWHVITRVPGYRGFMRAYVELLRENSLFTQGEIDDFLGGNALRFLGLAGGRAPAAGAADWTANRRRLAFFYQRNRIRPPAWFAATGRQATRPVKADTSP